MTEIVDDGRLPMSEGDPHADVSGREALISAAARLRSYGILLALLLLVAIVDVADPSFLSMANIVNMLGQWALTG
jgi:hypothetical protein